MIGRFIGVSPTVNDDEAALRLLVVLAAVYELARKEDTAGLRRLLCGSFGTDDAASSSVIVVLNLVVVAGALTEATLSCLGSEFFRLTPTAAACCCGGAFLLAA